MSDDLIKRLRAKKQKGNRFDSLEYEAADRIEQLNERLTAATDDAKEAEAYAEQLTALLIRLEAKLAKTVETLRKIGKTYSADGFRLIHSERQIINMVYIALAELEENL